MSIDSDSEIIAESPSDVSTDFSDVDNIETKTMLPPKTYKELLDDFTHLKFDFESERRKNFVLVNQNKYLKDENEKLKAENISFSKVIHDLSSELSKLSRVNGGKLTKYKLKQKRTRKKR